MTSFTVKILRKLCQFSFMTTEIDTLTHINFIVHVSVALMLGTMGLWSGNDATRIFNNYKLIFAILIFHTSSMMLTILTFPSEMNILKKEHFNRWYSLKAFFISTNIVGSFVPFFCCSLFTLIVYIMTSQPLEIRRFFMFLLVSVLTNFSAQSVGFVIGIVFDIVNGTFLGPTSLIPLMMFSGFGVRFQDLPDWWGFEKWGTYLSYVRWALEGCVAAIYGFDRLVLDCEDVYCHYKHPNVFLSDVDMRVDKFWTDVLALAINIAFFRILAYLCLCWKMMSTR